MVENFEKNFDSSISKKVVIGYAYYDKQALEIKEIIEEKYPDLKVSLAPIGTIIGAHVGPGMFSLCYFGTRD